MGSFNNRPELCRTFKYIGQTVFKKKSVCMKTKYSYIIQLKNNRLLQTIPVQQSPNLKKKKKLKCILYFEHF